MKDKLEWINNLSVRLDALPLLRKTQTKYFKV